MFMSTLGYTSDKFITTSLSNVNELGVCTPDMRGKHEAPHRLTEAQIDDIRTHITSFNPQISHYRREHAPNRLYLPPELTITEMYSDYSLSFKENAASYVSYSRQVRDMNISFAKLGDEECETCESHKMHLKEEKAKEDKEKKEDDKTKGTKNRKTNEGTIAEDQDSSQTNEKKGKKVEKQKHIDTEKICKKGDCLSCASWSAHHKNYVETREAYNLDKSRVGVDDKVIYLSSDMQKVILLPRLPGFKLNLFTKRLVVINQTFAPLNKADLHKAKALGVLWHEGLSGRKDEDVTSAYIAALRSVHYRDAKEVVIWLDNCSGQNKCWTLYTTLVAFVNCSLNSGVAGPEKVTLKYFTVGHTFMSADNFHRLVEKELKTMKKVCDWNDFVQCVSNVGHVKEMVVKDFCDYENGLSQGIESKETRPLLENVSVAEFRAGSTSLFYKTSHSDKDFKEALFLKRKIKESIQTKSYKVAKKSKPRGVNDKKLNDIIDKLGPLMPSSRLDFYKSLPKVQTTRWHQGAIESSGLL